MSTSLSTKLKQQVLCIYTLYTNILRKIILITITFLFSNDDDGKKLLEKLAELNRPLEISFNEMLKLMNQCEYVDKLHSETLLHRGTRNKDVQSAGLMPSSPFVIFSGIIPGKLMVFALSC